MSRTIKDYILTSLKGVAMGAADVVPGVSGGTIAFITGIYQELIDSIKSFNLSNAKLLLRLKIKEFWNAVNGNFLISLFLGIAISILSLAKLIHFLLDEYPIFIWSFFFGLIVASAIYVGLQIKKWDYKTILSLVVGALIAYIITGIDSSNAQDIDPSYWYVFVCGMIAICAMILPGISGSFILVLMGQYKFMLQVISDLKIEYIAIFGAGAAIGIVSFSNVLSWLLKKFHDATVAFLVGFMLGSLNEVCPWKHTLESEVNKFAEIIPLVQENVLPGVFYEKTGKEPYTFYAILMALTGFLIIFLIESTLNRKSDGKYSSRKG